MRGAGRTARLGVVAMAAVLGLSACRDNGLKDRNLPLEEARHRENRYPVYQASTEPPVAIAGHAYIGGAPNVSIPARLLTPVGDAQGTQLYSLRTEQAPFARLYASVGGDEWRPFERLN